MIVLQFTTEGECRCIYTEDFPLHKLGRQQMTRVSTIEWNDEMQQWEVVGSGNGVLFASTSRRQCLDWEHENQDRLLA